MMRSIFTVFLVRLIYIIRSNTNNQTAYIITPYFIIYANLTIALICVIVT